MIGEKQETAGTGARVENPGAAPSIWLLVITLISLLNHIDRRLLTGLAPLVQAEWGINDAQLGLVWTLYTLLRTMSSLPAGWLADRLGRLWVIRLSAVTWPLLTGLSGGAGQFLSFLSLRLGVAISDSANGPAEMALISDLYPQRKRGRALGFYNLSVYAGSGLGFALGGLIGGAFGWRWAFWLTAGLGGLLGLAVILLHPPLMSGINNRSFLATSFNLIQIGRALLQPPLPLVIAAGVLGTFAATGLAAWLPSFFVRQFKLDVAEAGSAMGLMILMAGISGTWLGGWSSDRILAIAGERPEIRSGGARLWAAAGGLWLALFAGAIGLSSPWYSLSLVCTFLGTMFLISAVVPVIALVEELVPGEWRASGMAVFGLFVQAFGAAPSALMVGAVSDRFGLRLGLLGALVVGGIGGLLMVFSIRWLNPELVESHIDGP